jgi:hypothetical protein
MHKNRILTEVIVITLGLMVVFIILFARHKPNIIKRQNYTVSTITAFQQKTVENTEQIDSEKEFNEKLDQERKTPLTYVLKDRSGFNQKFHLELTSLAQVQPVSCLTVEGNEYSNFLNVRSRTSDQNIIKFTQEIESHKYSNEMHVLDEQSGKKYIENEGKSSTREIDYEEICKINESYFFIFSGSGSTVHVGGGGSAPSHFAYSDKLGKLTILENIPSGFINLPLSEEVKESQIPIPTNHMAYYGCRHIYAANNSEVLIGCGGGDGPASGGGIFLINLTNGSMKEKVYCDHSSASKYSTLCFNEAGKIYYQELNQQFIR